NATAEPETEKAAAPNDGSRSLLRSRGVTGGRSFLAVPLPRRGAAADAGSTVSQEARPRGWVEGGMGTWVRSHSAPALWLDNEPSYHDSLSRFEEPEMKNELSNLDLAIVTAGAEKFTSKGQTSNTAQTNQKKEGKG